jgi:hypothetical protein
MAQNGARAPTDAELAAIVGHRFPGGTYTAAHWENFLLTGCTGAEPLPDGLLHPVALFHMPILGAGTSIAEMFALGRAESDYSIGIESYDWEFIRPLREETPYRIGGEVLSAKRGTGADGRRVDRIQFRFELSEPGVGPAARTTITWLYNRSAAA